MENNFETPQSQSVSPVSPLLQTQPNKSSFGKTLAMLVALGILVIVLLVSGYFIFLNKSQKVTYNAQVYNQPTIMPTATPIPSPSVYQVNTKDTSDKAIIQDTAATDQNLNNINSALNSVDQSFNDQQTNLQ